MKFRKHKDSEVIEDIVPKRSRATKYIKRSLLLALVAAIVATGFVGWVVLDNASKITGTKDPIKLISSLVPSKLSETNGHINILLAGYSADDPGHQGADLTDSIMIVSIDPSTKSAVMISIPRDLYVNIPGYGYQKINAAYEDGESENFTASGYPNGGMGLLEQVISNDFNVNFNYYALLNYAAFKDAVNAVGGVTLTINSPDPRGLYDPNTNLDLPNGVVTLDGQQALNLARARGDGPGSYGFPDADFDRTAHQQQILVALKNKASSIDIISDPLKIADLASAAGNNIISDITIGDVESIYLDSRSIPDRSISSVTLNDYQGTDYFADYTTLDGESALIPANGIGEYGQLASTLSKLTGSN